MQRSGGPALRRSAKTTAPLGPHDPNLDRLLPAGSRMRDRYGNKIHHTSSSSRSGSKRNNTKNNNNLIGDSDVGSNGSGAKRLARLTQEPALPSLSAMLATEPYGKWARKVPLTQLVVCVAWYAGLLLLLLQVITAPRALLYGERRGFCLVLQPVALGSALLIVLAHAGMLICKAQLLTVQTPGRSGLGQLVAFALSPWQWLFLGLQLVAGALTATQLGHVTGWKITVQGAASPSQDADFVFACTALAAFVILHALMHSANRDEQSLRFRSVHTTLAQRLPTLLQRCAVHGFVLAARFTGAWYALHCAVWLLRLPAVPAPAWLLSSMLRQVTPPAGWSVPPGLHLRTVLLVVVMLAVVAMAAELARELLELFATEPVAFGSHLLHGLLDADNPRLQHLAFARLAQVVEHSPSHRRGIFRDQGYSVPSASALTAAGRRRRQRLELDRDPFQPPEAFRGTDAHKAPLRGDYASDIATHLPSSAEAMWAARDSGIAPTAWKCVMRACLGQLSDFTDAVYAEMHSLQDNSWKWGWWRRLRTGLPLLDGPSRHGQAGGKGCSRCWWRSETSPDRTVVYCARRGLVVPPMGTEYRSSAELAGMAPDKAKAGQVEWVRGANEAQGVLGMSPRQVTARLFADAHLLGLSAQVMSMLSAAALEEDEHGVLQLNLQDILTTLLAASAAVEDYCASRCAVSAKEARERRGQELMRPECAKLAAQLDNAIYRIVATYFELLRHFRFPAAYADRLQAYCNFEQ